MTPLFLAAFNVTFAAEGETLDRTPSDRGNWTSGVIGVGTLVGSKFGISAATYPTLDIPNLTRDGAAFGGFARLDDLLAVFNFEFCWIAECDCCA